MPALHSFLATPWVDTLGRTLLHFLWQGAVLGLLVWLALKTLRKSPARMRYALGCLAMVGFVAAPVITFLVLPRALPPPPTNSLRTFVVAPGPLPTPAPVVVSTDSSSAAAGNSPGPSPARANGPIDPISPIRPISRTPATAPAPKADWSWFPYTLNTAAPWMVPFWFAGVLLMGTRLGLGWCRIQFWRRRAQPASDPALLAAFLRLAKNFRLGARVRLLISQNALGPLTFGWLKPVVLLPAGMLTGLPPELLEALLAHELAHIARHDYLFNLFQSTIEVILFYHPAIWWLGRHLRELREECCDEMALGACPDRLTYARALESLALWQSTAEPAAAASGGSLFERIARILGRKPTPSASSARQAAGLLVAGFVTLLIVLFSAVHLQAQSGTDPAKVSAAPSSLAVTANPAGNMDIVVGDSKLGSIPTTFGNLHINFVGSSDPRRTSGIVAVGKNDYDINVTQDTLTITGLSGSGRVVVTGQGKLNLAPVARANAVFSGSLSGDCALILSGPGEQTLSGINIYTGGTTVNGGTVFVENGAALGTGGLRLNAGNLDSPAGNTTLTSQPVTFGSAYINFLGTGNLSLGGSPVALAGPNFNLGIAQHELTLEGGMTGAGNLTVSGGGWLKLPNNATGSNFSGHITTGKDLHYLSYNIKGNSQLNMWQNAKIDVQGYACWETDDTISGDYPAVFDNVPSAAELGKKLGLEQPSANLPTPSAEEVAKMNLAIYGSRVNTLIPTSGGHLSFSSEPNTLTFDAAGNADFGVRINWYKSDPTLDTIKPLELGKDWRPLPATLLPGNPDLLGYQNQDREFSFAAPAAWKASEIMSGSQIGPPYFMTIDNQRPDLAAWFGSQHLQPGEIFIAASIADRPLLDFDSIAGDLRPILAENTLTKDGQVWSELFNFHKHGREFHFEVYLREPVTAEQRQQLQSFLESFHFADAPVSNETWAEYVAWLHLPTMVRALDWPIRNSRGNQTVAAAKNGSGFEVSFSSKDQGAAGPWRFQVGTNGDVHQLAGSVNPEPLPVNYDGWGEPVDGIQIKLRGPHSPDSGLSFFVDLRNRGEMPFKVGLPGALMATFVQIDGQWYSAEDGMLATNGWTIVPVHDVSEEHSVFIVPEHFFANSTDDLTKADKSKPLVLTPGKHTLRWSLEIPGKTDAKTGRPVRLVSNPLDFEIKAPAQPPAANAVNSLFIRAGGTDFGPIPAAFGSLQIIFVHDNSQYSDGLTGAGNSYLLRVHGKSATITASSAVSPQAPTINIQPGTTTIDSRRPRDLTVSGQGTLNAVGNITVGNLAVEGGIILKVDVDADSTRKIAIPGTTLNSSPIHILHRLEYNQRSLFGFNFLAFGKSTPFATTGTFAVFQMDHPENIKKVFNQWSGPNPPPGFSNRVGPLSTNANIIAATIAYIPQPDFNTALSGSSNSSTNWNWFGNSTENNPASTRASSFTTPGSSQISNNPANSIASGAAANNTLLEKMTIVAGATTLGSIPQNFGNLHINFVGTGDPKITSSIKPTGVNDYAITVTQDSLTFPGLRGQGNVSVTGKGKIILDVPGGTEAVFDGTISGDFTVEKTGAGTQTATGNGRLWSGSSFVTGGIVIFTNPTQVGGNVHLTGGTLQWAPESTAGASK